MNKLLFLSLVTSEFLLLQAVKYPNIKDDDDTRPRQKDHPFWYCLVDDPLAFLVSCRMVINDFLQVRYIYHSPHTYQKPNSVIF